MRATANGQGRDTVATRPSGLQSSSPRTRTSEQGMECRKRALEPSRLEAGGARQEACGEARGETWALIGRAWARAACLVPSVLRSETHESAPSKRWKGRAARAAWRGLRLRPGGRRATWGGGAVAASRSLQGKWWCWWCSRASTGVVAHVVSNEMTGRETKGARIPEALTGQAGGSAGRRSGWAQRRRRRRRSAH